VYFLVKMVGLKLMGNDLLILDLLIYLFYSFIVFCTKPSIFYTIGF